MGRFLQNTDGGLIIAVYVLEGGTWGRVLLVWTEIWDFSSLELFYPSERDRQGKESSCYFIQFFAEEHVLLSYEAVDLDTISLILFLQLPSTQSTDSIPSELAVPAPVSSVSTCPLHFGPTSTQSSVVIPSSASPA